MTASPEKVAEWLTQTGLEVEKVTPFVPLPSTLVIGETMTCVAHPNADRLKKLTVDIGKKERLQIICGASNVQAGQKVIVAPVGTTITSLEGVCSHIKKVKIRGEYSEGMICAAHEIGVGEAEGEIMVLETTRPAGTLATTYFGVSPDTIFDIDITPNMGHACSHLGVVRELAAVLGKQVDTPMAEPLIPSDSLPIEIKVKDATLCQRYVGVVIRDIEVGPSPLWLTNKLASIGVKSINNVVDITNFVMHGMGQPLHAFDYDQLEGPTLFVGHMDKKQQMTTLDGSTLSLSGEEIMIYDKGGPLCMAGIIGASRPKVGTTTKTIFLESATFSPTSVAKSARTHGIHTDASFRFERTTDIELPYVALQKATTLIQKLAKGTVASSPIDYYPNKAVATSVPMKYRYIGGLIGKEIPPTHIHAILKRLEIGVQDEEEEGFTALIPPYRTEVTRPADVVEEIVRIYGYDHIAPQKSYQGVTYTLPDRTKSEEKEAAITTLLSSEGYHEIKTNSLMDHASLGEGGKKAIKVTNPISQALNTLRPTLLYTGLDVVAHNLNHGNRMLKLFEIGRMYAKKEKAYEEKVRLSLFLAGEAHEPHWAVKSRNIALHDLYTTVTRLFHYLGLPSMEAIPKSHPHFDECIALVHKKEIYAYIGSVASHIREKKGIKSEIFFTEIPVERLIVSEEERIAVRYRPFPQTPAIRRDISLELAQKVTYAEVAHVIHKEKLPYTLKVYLKDEYRGKGIAKGHKSYTIHLVIQGKKTFQEKEITKIMQRLTSVLEKTLGAKVRE